MRGDSIRDLYAKALALLGLGVLAGTGALVDYWPIGISYPVVSSVRELPRAAGPAALPDPIPPVNSALNAVHSEGASKDEPSLGLMTAQASPSFTSLAVSTQVSSLGLSVALHDPSEIGSSVHASVQEVDAEPDTSFVPVDVVADAEIVSGYLPLDTRVPAVARASASDAGHGFISGAFKKTGSSIVKTGAKTGASIFDAVRLLGGAVRRALPN